MYEVNCRFSIYTYYEVREVLSIHSVCVCVFKLEFIFRAVLGLQKMDQKLNRIPVFSFPSYTFSPNILHKCDTFFTAKETI